MARIEPMINLLALSLLVPLFVQQSVRVCLGQVESYFQCSSAFTRQNADTAMANSENPLAGLNCSHSTTVIFIWLHVTANKQTTVREQASG